MTSTNEPGSPCPDGEFEHSLIEAIHEASPDGILVVDGNGMVVSHNKRMFEVFDIAPEEVLHVGDEDLVGKPDDHLLSRALELIRDPDSFLQRVQELYANPDIEDLCEIELKDGRTLERHSKALWGANRRYIGRVWFFRDITARKELERALEEISYRDPLTGVANRRHFFERAREEFARGRRYGNELSLIMVDIDHFKRINDRWGHAAGDRVLRNLCNAAQAVLRQEDLLGRLGGEEFAVLVPDTGLDGAFIVAERLRLQIAAQAVTEGSDIIRYTVSAGVTTLAAEDSSTECALQRADEALYVAKRAGRNCVARYSIG